MFNLCSQRPIAGEKTQSMITNGSLVRGEKLGTGAHGKVYKATRPIAVKVNLRDQNFDFIFSVKELEMNLSLRHPYVSTLQEVSYGNPFGVSQLLSPLNPQVTNLHNGMRPDDVHFIYPLAKSDLNDYLYGPNVISTDTIVEFMFQMLVSLEYIHSKGIYHRDIKINNFLIFEESGKLVCKLSDFGTAKRYLPNQLTSPMLTLAYCRAPECALINPVCDYKADIWALCCVFYELMTKRLPFSITTTPEMSYDEINTEIFSVMSTCIEIDRDLILSNYPSAVLGQPPSIEAFVGLRLNRECDLKGSRRYESFYTLMRNMFMFDPNKRPSATECLQSPLFGNRTRDVVCSETSSKILRFATTPDQAAADKVSYDVYRARKNLPWYTHRILFSAMSLFSRVLERRGSVFGEKTGIYFRACLYIFIKYFHNILRTQNSIPFSCIDPSVSMTSNDINEAKQFELWCIQTMGHELYTKTLYEKLCEQEIPKESDVYGLLVFYYSGFHDGRTLDESYNGWKNNRERLSRDYNTNV